MAVDLIQYFDFDALSKAIVRGAESAKCPKIKISRPSILMKYVKYI